MNICFTVSAMTSGGAERVVSVLSNSFVDKGHSVTIVMVSASKKESFYKLNPKIQLVALCENFNKKVKPFKRIGLLKSFLTSFNPDIVIAFLPHICIYTFLALRKTNIPFVLSERNDPNQYNPLYKLALKYVFHKAGGCVFQTRDALKWYKFDETDKARIIYNPVLMPQFDENIEKEKRIIFVGNNSSAKNAIMAIRAFQIFHMQHPDFYLRIYGEGHSLEQLSQHFDSSFLQSIQIMGKDNNWFQKEKSAMIYLSSSNDEGMSNSLLESASLGLVCIATDCPIGGSKEMSDFFPNIHLVEVNNHEEMAKTMNEHLNDKIEGEICVPYVFSLDRICEQWFEILSNVAQ